MGVPGSRALSLLQQLLGCRELWLAIADQPCSCHYWDGLARAICTHCLHWWFCSMQPDTVHLGCLQTAAWYTKLLSCSLQSYCSTCASAAHTVTGLPRPLAVHILLEKHQASARQPEHSFCTSSAADILISIPLRHPWSLPAAHLSGLHTLCAGPAFPDNPCPASACSWRRRARNC